MEEVGIDISQHHKVLVDNKGAHTAEKVLKTTGEKVLCHMQFNVYKIDFNQDAREIVTIPGSDLVALKWIELDTVGQYRLTPPSISLFKRLGYLQ